MRPIPFAATILLLVALVPPTSEAEGDWPMWRHDPALTGYQPTPGAMVKAPRIVARHLKVYEAATGTSKGEALDVVPLATLPLWGTTLRSPSSSSTAAR